MTDSLGPELTSWVEEVTGGAVLRSARMDRWRPSHVVTVRTAAGERDLVLKGPRTPRQVEARSRMLAGYGTRREAAALRVVQHSAVAAPVLYGYLHEQRAVLMQRVDGVGVLQGADPADRPGLMRQYACQLAALHDLEPPNDLVDPRERPDLPGPLAAVIADYDALRPRLERPDPLVDLALWWLRRHRPAGGERVLLHGDAGANQFLFHGDRLTALLDWELAHVGDPMSDLGYARFREALYPSDAYPDLVAEYATASGRPVDEGTVAWFTVVAALVMLAGISSDVQRPRARNPEALQRFWWDALARGALCQVLGETMGHPPAAPDDGPPTSGELTAMATLLAERLAAAPGSDDTSPGGHRHTLLLARALLDATLSSPDTVEATDAAELLGLPRTDPAGRHAAVTMLVHDRAEQRCEDLVRYFGRQAARRLRLMGPLAVTDTWGGAEAPPLRAGPVLPPVSPAGSGRA